MSGIIKSAPVPNGCSTDNKMFIDWIEKAIKNNHVKYYDYKDFLKFEEIGSGSFGKVYRADWKNPENPNDSLKKYMLVMEYADSGTLRNYLRENFSNLIWNDKFRIAYQLANAVSCLHNEGVIHRDLHSENVLVHTHRNSRTSRSEQDFSHFTIKLADFGLSKQMDILVRSKSATGAVRYVDPKKFTLEKYSLNEKSDVYSIGVLLWEISSGRQPYMGKEKWFLVVNVPKGLRETPIPNTPEDYIKIYTDCWKHEVNDRPNINEVVTRLDAIIKKNNNTNNSRAYNFDTDVQQPISSCDSFDMIEKHYKKNYCNLNQLDFDHMFGVKHHKKFH
ncbi:kinase-like domain-containing protein [Rhizophagus irregularis DAOM 181602=DAOM 197198]|uniref:Kinase-like domain-containing protein n=1 Tax=Rhizophagus irregularis (strain DAOM 181602 / DAOM 197198 / MUCL 43194) TaxID=747089 RepID=A0A2P4P368_RHIID|nr:kinase-like domain-containing protein [Rhizophagus irregularis DAOM 181602=DAOM 197198]POG59808.1 kinase-like domain-containing protein [Rhizophagus irregularis DAOM 181602=DAOM 197198]|eukprot:XP_025166674.1 kinase-like domain-containing protein [Rhizophagus irregularis DAOM 181602=DAOM 197198]